MVPVPNERQPGLARKKTPALSWRFRYIRGRGEFTSSFKRSTWSRTPAPHGDHRDNPDPEQGGCLRGGHGTDLELVKTACTPGFSPIECTGNDQVPSFRLRCKR